MVSPHRYVVIFIIAVCAMLIFINALTLRITSSLRAYIAGESLYSKGQKDAARHLITFIYTDDLNAWDAFESSIALPVGDSLARVALTDGGSDQTIGKAFLQGGNHPDDVDNLIWLFRHFKSVQFMEDGIEVWREADVMIGSMIRLGNELYHKVQSHQLTEADKTAYAVKVTSMSAALTVKEREFSELMGGAARSLHRFLLITNIVSVLLLIGGGGKVFVDIIRRISNANSQLKRTLQFGKLATARLDFVNEKIHLTEELLKTLEMQVPPILSFSTFLGDFVLEDDRALIEKHFAKVKREVSNVHTLGELEFRLIDRQRVPRVVRVKLTVDDDNVLALVQDVTEQRRLEQQAIQHAHHLEGILFSITDGFFCLDREWCFTHVNPVFAKMAGRKSSELLGKNVWTVFPASKGTVIDDRYHRAMVSGEAEHFELPAGERVFEVHAYPHQQGLFVFFRDITESKKTAKALRETNQLLRNLSDNLPKGAIFSAVVDEQASPFRYLYISHGLDETLKVEAPAIMQDPSILNGLMSGRVKEEISAATQRSLEDGRSFDIEVPVTSVSGEVHWINLRAKAEREGEKILANGIMLDVTSRKISELKLIHQQQLGEIISQAQSEFIADVDPKATFGSLLNKILTLTESEFGFVGEAVQYNDGPSLRMFALTDISWDEHSRKRMEQAPDNVHFTNFQTLFGHAMKEGLPIVSNQPSSDPRRGGLPPGHPDLNAFLGIPIKSGTEIVGMIGLANRPGGYDDAYVDFLQPLMSFIGKLIDLIRIERVKQQAQQEVKMLSLVASHTSNLVIFTDIQGKITWVNKSFEQVTGYTANEVIGKKPGAFLQGPMTNRESVAFMSAKLRSGQGFRTEILNYTKAGKQYWLDLEVMPVYGDDGEVLAFMSMQSDITRLKQLAVEAINARNQLQTIMDHAPMVVFMKDLDGKYLFFNQRYKNEINWRTLVPGMTDFDIFDHDFAAQCRERDNELVKNDQVLRFEHRVGQDDFYEMKFPVRNSAGDIYAVAGISIKVTETKLLQQAVEEREQRLQVLADNLSNGAIYQFEYLPDGGRFTYFSSGVYELTGINSEELMRDPTLFDKQIHPSDLDRHQQKIIDATSAQHEFENEFRLIHRNGEMRWMQVRSKPIVKEGRGILWNGIIIDITSSRKMREELEENHAKLATLLEEKDLLLREIHHRVKNNLQVISSVLFLKAQTLKDPGMRQLLMESRQRLRSMGFIHERLMQSGGHITRIDISDYINGLVEEQKQVNAIDPELTKVTVDVDPITMNLEKAVNCGFIINEAFTNAVKHAFPLGRKGTIHVSLKVKDDMCELVIADNGVGLPGHVNVENDDLFGIQLVRVFTSHLGGSVELDGTEGTIWKITFPMIEAMMYHKIPT